MEREGKVQGWEGKRGGVRGRGIEKEWLRKGKEREWLRAGLGQGRFFFGGGSLHRDERREGGIVRKVTCSLLILNLMKYASLG